MAVLKQIRAAIKDALLRRGYSIIETRYLYDWQMTQPMAGLARPESLPDGAKEYLSRANPRLQELKRRYQHFSGAVRTPYVWTDNYLGADDLLYFRSDNPYVFQLRGRNMNPLSYALTYFAVYADEDGRRLLELNDEDSLFGVSHFQAGSRLISRDLLDSVAELRFIERHVLSEAPGDQVFLDIGAGYGRLAHRTAASLPQVKRYLCTDAVPESSFLCEYYLRFRHVANRAVMVPLDEIESAVRQWNPTLAINVHSFSECSLEAIDWWCKLLARNRVPNLMVVPNRVGQDGLTMLTNDGKDFSRIVESSGYAVRKVEPKYLEPVVQAYGINPTTHFLFSLE